MGLSLNPMSWTPSNLAESAVEFVTGSEAAGDIAGLIAADMTGDVKGMAEQGADLGENLVAGGKKFLEGFGSALKDAFQVFSNPGAVKAPETPATPPAGYADGAAAGQTDTGPIGKEDAGKINSDPNTGSLDGDLDSILKGGGSLEDKIFAVLMLLQKDKKKEVEKKIGSLSNPEDKEKNLQELQKSTGEMSQLTQLTTGLMQNFKQMKDSVIQNIR